MVNERRTKILHFFTRWVAASAARQGSEVRGSKLYELIDGIEIVELLSGPVSADGFAEWHRRQVKKLGSKLGIGWAAKIVNMVTKTRIYIACEGDPSLRGLIHPPIDNELIDAIRSRYPLRTVNDKEKNGELRSLCDQGKPIKGITAYDKYCDVIAGLRLVAEREGCSLFEVESLWEG